MPQIECLLTFVPCRSEPQFENLLSFTPKLNMKATELMARRSKRDSPLTNGLLARSLSEGNSDMAAAICAVFFSEEISPGCLGMTLRKCQY
jgi:hypothetical protein